ncbi:TetR/AcrR family transcriptional regulator [Frondihabitans cladoniiphilus]|uniref:TetR/AcrR family transcriptional regulator n=1 Tax=Frondihabitans cladoniiphilus TaxID=715785 RepID=A0ABP8VJH8_9MICO
MAYVKTEVRSQQFVEAARRVAERDGVAKLTLRSVASEAGASLGILHYTFPSKEELLASLLQDVIDEATFAFRDNAADPKDLAATIRAGLGSFWNGVIQSRDQLQTMQYELTTHALRTEGLRPLAREQYEQYSGLLRSWLVDVLAASARTSQTPVDVVSRVLLAALDGLIIQYLCDPDPVRSVGDLNVIADVTVHMLGA